MKCARCGQETNQDFHSLCPDCYPEVGLYGDEENAKMWRGASLLINTEYTQEDLTALADAPAFQDFIKTVIDAMPLKEQFVLLLAKKLTGE
jgi:hypothetical protein